MKVRCPICDNEVEMTSNPFRPFCSKSCQDRDLGRWATEDYRIPSTEHEAALDEKKEKQEE